ncbi:putative hydroxyacid oxidase 1 isoform X1 [Apostichopus japonicus]|uniref:Putative hydroxyacid oxidase 1 isoform X1 n=1 Tax=Stichopus japonicus TaxID=307972 RepID=A0A2G8KVX3_STIJA|nr:putative hydroxyacid oxidase 1 isoform X1 [Apostichopus japonicus]
MAEEIVKTLNDFEMVAKRKICHENRWLWNYISAGDEKTRSEMRAAFQKYWLQPNVLTARVAVPSTWTTVLGQPIRMPICISPTSAPTLIDSPDGDALVAKVVAERGTLMVYSSVSKMNIEKFGSKLPPNGIYWAQTYLFRDKRNTLHLVRHAEKYGFKALVVTVDSPIDFGSNSVSVDDVPDYLPEHVTEDGSPNLAFLDGKPREKRPYGETELWTPFSGPGYKEIFCVSTWEDLAWLKTQTKLPIVLKGILTAKAAKLAVKAGVDGILVSSHGGRQLVGAPPPLAALPDVIEAVKGTNIEVYLDGEVRSGSDIFKAIALGARAVFIARPILWGLAVNQHQLMKLKPSRSGD